MPRGTASLTERARDIFEHLDYAVTDDGAEISAVRGWKEVAITPVRDGVDAPEDGSFRAFVTWNERVGDVTDAVSRVDPDYEWAVIGVDPEGDYEVAAHP
ncbi:MAG: hypothetical protein ABEJ42_04180 [Halobacteriaceae archaeon]